VAALVQALRDGRENAAGTLTSTATDLRKALVGDEALVYFRECGGVAAATARLSSLGAAKLPAWQEAQALLSLLTTACANDFSKTSVVRMRRVMAAVTAGRRLRRR
jgi:hypothetical protein